MAEATDSQELVPSLKQLIIGFGPYLRQSGSVEQAEDSILHMEENDENFHRYDFVRRLQNHLENSLGHFIDEELERRSLEPEEKVNGQEPIVSKITDQVINSHIYEDMMASLQLQVNQACEHILDNFDEEFGLVSSIYKPNLSQQEARPKSELFFDDCDSSLGDSSLNQGLMKLALECHWILLMGRRTKVVQEGREGESEVSNELVEPAHDNAESTFMLMNTEQFSRMAEDLDRSNPVEQRKSALIRLMQTSSVDVQNSKVWGRIRKGLLDALVDSDQHLWTLALKFLSRGFSSSNPSTREIYTTLVEFLVMQFNASNKSNIPKVKNGLDCRRIENIKILKAFRLLSEVQQQVPQYWIRYPEIFLEEILESTLELLNIHHSTSLGTPAQLTPLHCLALIDTKASWLSRWLHGHYSRDPLLNMLLNRHKNHKNIVVNAVRACMEFTASRKVPFDLMSEASETVSRDSAGESQRLQYTGPELEYVYFVHSLYLLARLICYKKGRELFPLKLKDREESVTVTSVVTTLVQLLTAASPVGTVSSRSLAAALEPGYLVTEVFRKLCSMEATCEKCLCKDSVTNALLAPVSAVLDRGDTEVSESTLQQIADIISMMASSASGRQHLLYGQAQEKFTRAKSSPAHILALFASKGLAGELTSDLSNGPSSAVLGSYIYLCRLLYNTCEGLLVLYPYDLHSCVAAAWGQAVRDSEMAATPTPSMDSHGNHLAITEHQYLLLWEDMLRDNLLNFASTPKGVLLLQQTAAINECLVYLDARYSRRLQVSKCEKFGYGYMMSQVSCTAVGMAAISHTEYIRSLVRGLWHVLEGIDDKACYIPRTYPVTLLDKSLIKPFNNLVGVLSSYHAVYELLVDQPLPTQTQYSLRDVPETIPGFLDRLVLVDTEAKIHALFNYEQSHGFGLRLLSLLVSCLDSLLLLHTHYNILQVLLNCQDSNRLKDGTDIIIDMLSMERNYILVKAFQIGGPSERILPIRCLAQKLTPQDQTSPFPFPLFAEYPLPKEYMINVATKAAGKIDNELSKLLSETKQADLSSGWLERCRKAFCNVLTTKPDQARAHVLQDVLECSVSTISHNKEEAIFPLLEFSGNESIVKGVQLSRIQQEGIKMAVRYGQHLKLLPGDRAEEGLVLLMKQVDYYLLQQQRTNNNSPLRCLQKGYVGFDWFVCTVYLLMSGNKERSWSFLQKFSSLAASAYLWPHRLHASVHLPACILNSGIPAVFSSTCHNIELVLQAEVNHVHSAFKMSGFSPAQICQQWLRQCFWNYLDWMEICHYICLCLLLGVDYQVYICVAILRFRQRPILHHVQEQDLATFLKEEPLTGFRVGDHLEYMQQLAKKFRATILPDMLNISKP